MSRGSDGMAGENRFVIAEAAIDQLFDQFVPLGIETAIRSWLRYAVTQLPIAKIVIWRHRDFLRRRDRGFRRVIPIDVDFVEIDAIVLKDLHDLRTAGGHHDIGS